MTKTEKKLLEYIIVYKQVNGCSPSRDDMKRGLGVNSNRMVDDAILNLEEGGYIEVIPRRGIRVIDFNFLHE